MKRQVVALGLAMTLLGLSSEARAAMIGFRPSPQLVTVGDTLVVDLYIDLGPDAALGLGAFDVTLDFTPSGLQFDAYTLGSQLGDVDDLESSDFSLGGDGRRINLTQLSFLSPSALTSLQATNGGVFTLATLQFTALRAGNTGVNPTMVLLAAADGTALDLDGASSLAVTIQEAPVPVPVPEPASLLLMGSGVAAFVWRRRRTRRSEETEPLGADAPTTTARARRAG
jgi:PEP-CTERM motif